MAEPIAEAFVEVNAKLDRLEKQLRGATAVTDRNAKKMERSFGRVEKAGRRIRSTFRQVGAAIATVFAARAVRSTLDLADSLDKTSNRLGVNVEELQRLRFAAGQAGVDIRTFDLALQRFTRRLQEAKNGTGEAQQALRDLSEIRGINLLGLAPLEALEEIADAFAEIEDAGQRVQLAFKLFDSEGVRLLQLLGDGAAAIAELKQQADSLGLVLSDVEIRGLVEAKDQFTALSQVIEVRFAKAIIELQPALDGLSKLFLTLATSAGVLFRDLDVLFNGPDLTTLRGVNQELKSLDERISQLRARPLRLLSDEDVLLVTRLEAEFEDVLAIRDRLLDGRPGSGGGGDPLSAEAILDAEEDLFQLEQDRLELQGRFDEARERQLKRDLEAIRAQEGITDSLREQLLLARQLLDLDQQEAEDTESAQAGAEAEVEKLRELGEESGKLSEEIERDLSNAFSRAFDRALADGKLTFDELGKALVQSLAETALQQVIDAISSGLGNVIVNGLGGGGFGGLFGAASGGIIRRPTLVAAGEKGAEAIVPLDRLGDFGGGGMVVQVVNATGAPTSTEESSIDGRQFMRVIIGEIENDIRNRGRIFSALKETSVGVRSRGVRR